MFRPIYSSFPQKIWRIFPDLLQDRLTIESRDSAKKNVYGWSVLLLQSNAVSLELSENWWCSLCTVHEGFSVWQGIEEEGLPIPLGIYVFDQQSGKLLWEAPELKFLHCGPEVIIATNPQETDRVYYLETRSGTLRDEVLQKDVPMDLLAEYDRNRFAGVHYPDHLSPGTDACNSLLDKMPPMPEQVGPVSYLRDREYDILHRYQLHPDTQSIDGMITIYKEGNSLIANLPTGQYPNGFTLDPFFLMKNWLVWVEFPGKLGRIELP